MRLTTILLSSVLLIPGAALAGESKPAPVEPAGAFVVVFDQLSGQFLRVPAERAKRLGLEGVKLAPPDLSGIRARRTPDGAGGVLAHPNLQSHTLVGAIDAKGRAITICLEHALPMEEH